MSHDITERDLGVRVKAICTSDNDPTAKITYEGSVTSVYPDGSLYVENVYVKGSVMRSQGWTIAVERIRPPVPTGLGAIVRLDSARGPVAVRVRDGEGDAPWQVLNSHLERAVSYRHDDHVAQRIHSVISPGVPVEDL